MAGRRGLLVIEPKLQKAFCDTLISGATIRDACLYVGVDESTVFRWLQKGEKARLNDPKTAQYREFSKAVKMAQGEARIRAMTTIASAQLRGEWTAAAWFLERSDPEHWGKKDKLSVEIGVDAKLVARLVAALSAEGLSAAEVFEAMLKEMANADSGDSR